MITRTQGETNRQDTTESRRTAASDSALNFAALVCMVAGGIGIVKAMQMQLASDGLLCALGSVTACVLVGYLYFRKD